MNLYVKGKYKTDIFKAENGYTIGKLKVSETNIETYDLEHELTITGYFYDLNIGDNYIFHGEIVEHPKYGLQFNVSESERIKPTDKDGIIEFLSSDLFPGVGLKLATKIVETLKERALELILEDKNNLLLVKKISSKKIEVIYNTLISYENSHATIVHLCDIGFNSNEALVIYNAYRNQTLNKLEENIYEFGDLKGISFLKIDQVRHNLDISDSDPRRLKASLFYVLETLIYKQGDTYLEIPFFYQEVIKFLNFEVSESLFSALLDKLKEETKIIISQNRVYLKNMFYAEANISGRLKEILKNHKKYKNLDSAIAEIELKNNIKYNEKQKEAIISSLVNGISLITGGPGTGKTTIIKAIVELYQSLNELDNEKLSEELTLLAPTGRASKRLSEATNLPALTIHRFLKWHKETDSFEINEYNKAFSRFIIVDEASMIDVNLFDSLLKGLTKDIQLVIVGDYNQLPSVGPGTVLKDLIDSNMFSTIVLDLLYRQSKDSFIPILADRVKNGLTDNLLVKENGYLFLECNRNSIRKNIEVICKELLKKDVSSSKVQFLAPMYKSYNGIDNLNSDLQAIFNPNGKEKVVGTTIYRVGDRVIELINMPDLNVYNGDIGYIVDIVSANVSSSKKDEIVVNYDGNIVTYLPKDYAKIKIAYAISIHKSQGSEFDTVIIPLSLEYNKMLYRKLIYTGLTRAKKKLILLGEVEAFKYSINNTNEYIRKTSLLERLKS